MKIILPILYIYIIPHLLYAYYLYIIFILIIYPRTIIFFFFFENENISFRESVTDEL